MKTYEGMFLFDPSFATDMKNVEQEVARLMERADAKTIMCDKWEERKLAYEIDGRKRGCYVLVFFEADPEKITSLERDVQLSESVLRVLILQAEYMTEEMMKKAYPIRQRAESATTPPASAVGEKPEGESKPETPAPDSAVPEPATAAAEPAAEESAASESAAATATAEPPKDEEA